MRINKRRRTPNPVPAALRVCTVAALALVCSTVANAHATSGRGRVERSFETRGQGRVWARV